MIRYVHTSHPDILTALFILPSFHPSILPSLRYSSLHPQEAQSFWSMH